MDRESGSSQISLNLLTELERISTDEGEPENVLSLLDRLYDTVSQRRSLISPINLVWIIRESYKLSLERKSAQASLKEIVGNVKRMHSEALESSVRSAEKTLTGLSTILTISKSSQVLAALKRLAGLKVRVLAGWPLMDGVAAYNELVKAGIRTRLFPDLSVSEALDGVDAVLLGCDAVLLDGSAANRSGSKIVALVARESRVPVFVICDPTKLDVNNVWVSEKWSLMVEGRPIDFQVFEKIDHNLITGYVYGAGFSDPSSFVAAAKEEVTALWPRRAAGLW